MAGNNGTSKADQLSDQDMARLVAEAQAEPGIADLLTMLEHWKQIDVVVRESTEMQVVARDSSNTSTL
jgi:hypothetical protein